MGYEPIFNKVLPMFSRKCCKNLQIFNKVPQPYFAAPSGTFTTLVVTLPWE
jgi:hypothetical protein